MAQVLPPDLPLPIVLGGAGVVLLIGGVLWWRARRSRHDAADIPLYSVTLTHEPVAARSRRCAEPRAAPPAKPPTAPPTEPPSVPAASPSPEARAAGALRERREFTTGSATPAATTAVTPAATPPVPAPAVSRPITAHGVPGTEVEGQLLRFSVPQEGTLRFLPGRLEILSGLEAGREIRFVHVPGPDGTTVTFGRSDGPAYRHIQLREATVSRAHARLRLAGARWHLTNLSTTNPVVVNGRALEPDQELPVADGDRIEMGEVVFGFRSR